MNAGPNTASLSIDGNPTEFVPGQTYTVTARIDNATGTACGFQVAILDRLKAPAGVVTAGSGSSITSSGGRSYVTHSNPNSRTWTFTWKAPTAVTVDTVTFYMAAMESFSGVYHTYTFKKGLKKFVATGVEEVAAAQEFSVFPTMATQKITIRNPRQGQKFSHIQILGLDGREYFNQSLGLGSNETEILFPSGMKPGPYIVRLVNSDGIQIRRILKF